MTWLASNWDAVMTIMNAIGLLLVASKRTRS